MRRLAVPLAALALLAGGACIVLGLAVLGERARLDRDRAALASPPGPPLRPAGAGTGALLLGTGADHAALAAGAAFVAARRPAAPAPAERLRARAEDELTPLAEAGPAARRSWADTLLAVLELDRAQAGGPLAARHVAAARGALEDAVAGDPQNEQAKRDLELLLTLQQQSRKQRSHRRARSSANRTPQPPQAGFAAAGKGW